MAFFRPHSKDTVKSFDPSTWRSGQYFTFTRNDCADDSGVLPDFPPEINVALAEFDTVYIRITPFLLRICQRFVTGGLSPQILIDGPPATGKSTLLFVLQLLALKRRMPYVYIAAGHVMFKQDSFELLVQRLVDACEKYKIEWINRAHFGSGEREVRSWADLVRLAASASSLPVLYEQIARQLKSSLVAGKVLFLLDQYNGIVRLNTEDWVRSVFGDFKTSWNVIAAISSSFPGQILLEEREFLPGAGVKQTAIFPDSDLQALGELYRIPPHLFRRILADSPTPGGVYNAVVTINDRALDRKTLQEVVESDLEETMRLVHNALLDYYKQRVVSICDRNKYSFPKRAHRIGFAKQLRLPSVCCVVLFPNLCSTVLFGYLLACLSSKENAPFLLVSLLRTRSCSSFATTVITTRCWQLL
eukprot:TRINITY_DN2089_c1_g2_i1.p1 TRINITY_DN2089_c1_g2~~TRINITY_DN2089_c1_g2_i1.p1  ORF type:complete len:417 (+),score=54.86 TRINITY_DN2089_c1_g2_i1:125-1375(+)